MSFYPRLRDLREDNNETLQDIAKLLNTTFQYYQKYEKGIRDIPFERIIILANHYNVSIDYIAGRTNKKEVNK